MSELVMHMSSASTSKSGCVIVQEAVYNKSKAKKMSIICKDKIFEWRMTINNLRRFLIRLKILGN